MQHNYEYLKDTAQVPFGLEVIAGRQANFPLKYAALFEDLRVIEDNYRLLKKLDILLRDPTMNNLSDVELKIALKSCAHSIVQAVCRLLEKPDKRNLRKTNCIYARIQKDIKREDIKKRCLIRHQKIISENWYIRLRDVRDKRISHQEGSLDMHSVKMIEDFLSQPMQIMINAIRDLLEFCASANLNGGRAKYVSRNRMRKQQKGTTVDHKPNAEMKTYAQEVGSTFVGMDASNPLKNYIRPILEMASWRGCARVAYCQEAATEGTPITPERLHLSTNQVLQKPLYFKEGVLQRAVRNVQERLPLPVFLDHNIQEDKIVGKVPVVTFDSKNKSIYLPVIGILYHQLGRDVLQLIEEGIPAGISLHGDGVVVQHQDNYICKHLNIISFDLVTTPGFSEARVEFYA